MGTSLVKCCSRPIDMSPAQQRLDLSRVKPGQRPAETPKQDGPDRMMHPNLNLSGRSMMSLVSHKLPLVCGIEQEPRFFRASFIA